MHNQVHSLCLLPLWSPRTRHPISYVSIFYARTSLPCQTTSQLRVLFFLGVFGWCITGIDFVVFWWFYDCRWATKQQQQRWYSQKQARVQQNMYHSWTCQHSRPRCADQCSFDSRTSASRHACCPHRPRWPTPLLSACQTKRHRSPRPLLLPAENMQLSQEFIVNVDQSINWSRDAARGEGWRRGTRTAFYWNFCLRSRININGPFSQHFTAHYSGKYQKIW